jgi:hypothetical protein
MPSQTSKQISYIVAQQFKEGFYEPSPTLGYVFIGNHVRYADETTPTNIEDTIHDEKTTWDNMFAAKRITGNDVELVIPKVTWTADTKYKQYDDRVSITDLIEANNSLNVKPFYVYTSQRSVYKCLSNNASGVSTVEPFGDYTSSNGNIATSDGYLWKYMYSVKPSNRFLTDDWIPVPDSTSQLDYSVSPIGVVDGELASIIVTNPGSGYIESKISVIPQFVAGQTNLILANTIGVAANMFISGTGLAPQTYILQRQTYPGNGVSAIDISTATIAAGGANTTANQLTLTTRVYVDGDGTSIVPTPTLTIAADSANAQQANISKVTVSTIGTGYSQANAFVYGTGTGATLRAILDPKYGHGYNPAKELGANSVMVTVKMGEIETTEGGKIPANTTFRQYGIFVDPHKYGEANVVTPANAASVVAQSTLVNLVTGADYYLDEFVYQGVSASTATAYGYILDQPTTTKIRITNTFGNFITGAPLIGVDSGTSRLIISAITPEFQPYSGPILHTENVTKITRTDGQAENIKLIVRL